MLAQVSTQQLDSKAVQSQAGHRRDLDAALSNRLHELLGTPLGEKPYFIDEAVERAERWRREQEASAMRSENSKHTDVASADSEKTDQTGRKGDVAKGIVLLEEKDALYLALHCKNEIVTFHKPYEKQRTGSATVTTSP